MSLYTSLNQPWNNGASDDQWLYQSVCVSANNTLPTDWFTRSVALKNNIYAYAIVLSWLLLWNAHFSQSSWVWSVPIESKNLWIDSTNWEDFDRVNKAPLDTD